MRHSLDLLLDASGDAAVRAEWRLLSEAGLPSSGDRQDATHGPHVTLAERDEVPAEAERAVGTLVASLPLALHLGPPVVLGTADRWFLARSVVPSAALLALHAEAAELLGPGGPPWAAPGAWLPHVTLSRRLTTTALTEALGLLGPAYDVAATRLRRWDPEARTVRDL
ncbi:2'-5' RNA ligase family protein [Nocardioides alkalitolerans]|uniref:2'-5' RNA ligase family protein n=1 Tax=Nocardioides alkalitolerans TaxID=281714 RepID=UPI00041C17E2|nr:2'-5' RNA ligase family protein [Nocardioides alkalitolerans]